MTRAALVGGGEAVGLGSKISVHPGPARWAAGVGEGLVGMICWSFVEKTEMTTDHLRIAVVAGGSEGDWPNSFVLKGMIR